MQENKEREREGEREGEREREREGLNLYDKERWRQTESVVVCTIVCRVV